MPDNIIQILDKPAAKKGEPKKSLSHIKHTIMVMSGKGGVGKSTVSANLAVTLSMEGYRTGILDGDVHGPNIPKILGVTGQPLTGDEQGNIRAVEGPAGVRLVSVGNLLENQDQPVIWRGPMKHSIMRHFINDVNWGELDFLIVDLPPGTGDEPLSIAQIIKQAQAGSGPYAVVVTTPQDVALLDSRKSVEFSKSLNLKMLGIIENMSGLVCPHCGKRIDLFKRGGGERAAKDLNVNFLGAIPIDPAIVINTDDGEPFVISNKESPSTRAFKEVADKIMKQFPG
jgi:ATP-binding protein involved in chromosome partitioning